ncbi:mechanosensitive ion channel family protein [Methylocella silvestris]|uniref:Small-conductance mechanosensitive channel n=1 Tax=Methylocella silvestris TaxID=199596 RepID=A0A2J7THC0_METSI|nr:mechanosensitive ion channel family protein [Methylocella silvestris]PNG26164.1 mechanosensitive ion channel protein [Methylocella silvestris]
MNMAQMQPAQLFSLAAEHSDIAVMAGALSLGCVSLAILALRRDAMWRLTGRLGSFVALTAALASQGIQPYQPRHDAGQSSAHQIGLYFIEVLWWIALARSLVGIVDAFVIFERKPQESRLFQQLIAGLIYLGVAFAIVGQVFEVPVGALFATSGAVAIIAGLALQSTLADVFSGVAISLGRSYRIGDWIVVDSAVEGRIVETNWQNVHLLTSTHDLAIIPNSVIAKARLLNQSWPDSARDARVLVRLRPAHSPAAIVELGLEAMASCNLILHDPPPTATVKSLNGSAIEVELKCRVHDRTLIDSATNEVFDRFYRHAVAAGLSFAPDAGDSYAPDIEFETPAAAAGRITMRLPLFGSLAKEDRAALAEKMKRKEYEANEVVIGPGELAQSLGIVQAGALALYHARDDRELTRLAPGDYFGEGGLLLGEPQQNALRAVTRAVVYEIGAADLAPMLRSRPGLSHQLGEALAQRRAMEQKNDADVKHHTGHTAKRFADRIMELFQLDLTSAR